MGGLLPPHERVIATSWAGYRPFWVGLGLFLRKNVSVAQLLRQNVIFVQFFWSAFVTVLGAEKEAKIDQNCARRPPAAKITQFWKFSAAKASYTVFYSVWRAGIIEFLCPGTRPDTVNYDTRRVSHAENVWLLCRNEFRSPKYRKIEPKRRFGRHPGKSVIWRAFLGTKISTILWVNISQTQFVCCFLKLFAGHS